MKRIFMLLIIMLFGFGLVGCNNEKEEKEIYNGTENERLNNFVEDTNVSNQNLGDNMSDKNVECIYFPEDMTFTLGATETVVKHSVKIYDENNQVKYVDAEIKENTNSELMELNTKIREMTALEFLEFFKEYNIFLYRSYAFFEYENDICIAVMFNDDNYSIKECYSYKKSISNNEVISQIKIGMTPMEVVKIIGIPKLSTTSGLSSLDFYINDSIIRIFLSSPDYIYDVRIIELQK